VWTVKGFNVGELEHFLLTRDEPQRPCRQLKRGMLALKSTQAD